MEKSFLIFVVLVALLWKTQAKSPCEEGSGGGHRILNEPDRSQENTNANSPKCDDSSGLKAGWVRFEGDGGTVMSTSAPAENRCNTHAPGYLTGGHPSYEEGTVERGVCFVFKGNTCIKEVKIHVRNCGNFYVYELELIAFCKLRYCTDPNGVNPTAPPPPPTTVPPGPDVPVPTPSIKVQAKPANIAGGGKKVQVVARCDLAGKKAKKVELEAMWVIDGVEVPVRLGKKTKFFELKELENGFKAGTTISCQIRGRFKKGNDKRWSAYTKSEEVFTGITITPDTLTVREDEPGKPIVASIPFAINGAGTDFTVSKDLALRVTRGGAAPKDVTLSKTLLIIAEGKLQSDELIATALRDFVDDGTKKMEVHFVLADDEPGESQFWKGYPGLVTKITSVDVTTSTCITCGDPHITTFDGRYYNHLRNPGDYVLTKNTERNFEIHARIWRCWSVVCNCGVAIRENNDVIKIDGCNGAPRAVQLSPDPLNGRVRVKRANRGGYTEFRVFLHSGADVKVNAYGSYVNLYLTTPSDDFNRTAGQCANNNNNAGDEYSNEEVFKNSMRIPSGQSLFDKLPAKVATPPDVCGSKENGNVGYLSCTVNRPGINLDAVIRKPRYSVKYCNRYEPRGELEYRKCCRVLPAVRCEDVILANGNLQYGGRRKRDLSATEAEEDEERFFSNDDYEHHELYYDFHNSENMKRTTPGDAAVLPAWGDHGVSEAQAKAKCKAVLVDSVAGKTCGELGIGIDDRMDECVLDIRVTGDLSIADSAMSSLTHICEDKALKNPDLYEEDENGNMVPPTKFLGAICPADCSGHGQCKDGKCECNSGFGAMDCSIDLNKPPVATGIQGEGLCDLDIRKCKIVRLEGKQFLESDKLTCHFKPFKFEDGEAVPDGDVVTTKAHLDSMVEVACPIPEADQDKMPWSYFVSVSNNGVDQSDKFKVVVFHSFCNSCKKNGKCIEMVHKRRACVIGGICYGRQVFKQGNVCLKCHPFMNRNKWTPYKADKGPKFDMQKLYKVCVGQKIELELHAADPEGTKVSFSLDDSSPAGSSISDGVFTLEVPEGKAKVSAFVKGSDECGKWTRFEIKMAIHKCKCKNGGKCLNDTEDSPDCSYSLRCECPNGFSGNRCQNKE